MSNLVVDAVGDFFNNLELRGKVLSFSDDGTNTTLSLDSVFNARAMPSGFERTVDVDGTDYNILAVDYNAKSITVSGVIASPSIATFPNPFYLYGTLISAASELDFIDAEQKAPLVYLNEIITEELQPRDAAYASNAKIRLAFADYYSTDWTLRSEHYDNVIRPLSNLAQFVKKKLEFTYSPVYLDSTITQRTVPKWGRYSRKGVEEKVFNDFFDAIEWEFNLFVKDCNC